MKTTSLIFLLAMSNLGCLATNNKKLYPIELGTTGSLQKKYSGLYSRESVKENYQKNHQYGFSGSFDIGYSWGKNNTTNKVNTYFTTSFAYSYAVGHYFLIGAGGEFLLGMRDIITYESNSYASRDYIFPLFINAKICFWDRKYSPYVDLRMGYSFGSYQGLYFSPSVGLYIKNGSGPDNAYISIGYTMQSNNSFSTNGEKMNILTFRFGLEF